MGSDRFDIRWVGHCTPEDKIWGWYIDDSMQVSPSLPGRTKIFFCFWAVRGKTISIKQHQFYTFKIDNLVKKKIANRYQGISREDLINMWPSFYEDLHRRVIFETLSGDV